MGDNGYACKPYLLTPLLNPDNESEAEYNRAHILTRNTIERFFGVIKRRFPCLQNGLRIGLASIPRVIVACGVLYNICKEQNDLLDENIGPVINGDGDYDDNLNEPEHDNVHQAQNPNYAVRNAIIANVFGR